MKDLLKLVAECEADLDFLGIKYRKVHNWSVNTRATSRWGCCKTIAPGLFDISISAELLADELDDQKAKNTIIHELLHTVDGCHGHKGKWKRLAEKVNSALPQYEVKCSISYAEQGIKPDIQYKYSLRCEACGQMIYRQRETEVIKNPHKYRCGKCKGKLMRIY
ncbi:MAG: SprT-like domain-containing protein [Clostridia bacterium]|nr:SprT-like domain-containing protein [Clostridia bacterium]